MEKAYREAIKFLNLEMELELDKNNKATIEVAPKRKKKDNKLRQND